MAELISCVNVECRDVPGSPDNYFRCHRDFCPVEYDACLSDQAQNPPDNQQAGPHDTCREIHEAVLDSCVPAYGDCVAGCQDQACQDRCSADINQCIQAQQNAAPAGEAQRFEAMLGCRNTNRDTCYNQADGEYTTCNAACNGDAACARQCAERADGVYESCFANQCSAEYAACGL